MRDASATRRREYRDQAAETELRDARSEAGTRLHEVMLDVKKIRKSRRGPQKPAPKRIGSKPHFSTQRLLDAAG